MKELNEDLMDQVLESRNLRAAWKSVKANRGAAGIDGISVEAFLNQIRPHWKKVLEKLETGRYKPALVKRVYIPKGNGKKRPLGIPTVLDRMIQQAIAQVIQPYFEWQFSEYSYGFRPGRNAHHAIKKAQQYCVAEGKDWVVDIDLQSFFDEVNHDRLMYRIAKVIRDKRVLSLIGRYLRTGVYEDGQRIPVRSGIPQGGPLSPLLANIYLDPLDKELEKRGLSFCRYADDCNIYVGSQAAAERVFDSVTRWIEKHLGVPVNREKSDYGRPWDRQFLGYKITEKRELKPSDKSLEKYKSKVRYLFSGRISLPGKALRDHWLKCIRGWCNYFHLAEDRFWREDLSRWTRRHIRKWFWLRWHGAKGRRRNLLELGVTPKRLRTCPLHGSSWPMSRHPAMHTALCNKTLKKYNFLTPSDFAAS